MREQAQEDQASTGTVPEAGEAGKQNGYPLSTPLSHAQSATQLPSDDSSRHTPLSRIPTAPPLSTYPEEASEPMPPLPTSPQPVQPTQPPLPPIPDEPTPPLSPKKSDHQLRKERRALEKEKDKTEKTRQKEQEQQNRERQRREAEELRKAIEASKADANDVGTENGSPRKSTSFGFLKRGSRSLSQRLNKDKEPRVSTSDLSTSPLLSESVSEAPTEAQPTAPKPIKPSPVSPPIQSPVSPREFPPISNHKPIRGNDPLNKDHHTPDKPTHRWRSFSFKKVS